LLVAVGKKSELGKICQLTFFPTANFSNSLFIPTETFRKLMTFFPNHFFVQITFFAQLIIFANSLFLRTQLLFPSHLFFEFSYFSKSVIFPSHKIFANSLFFQLRLFQTEIACIFFSTREDRNFQVNCKNNFISFKII